MDSSKKTRKELIEEVEALRLRLEELEHSQAEESIDRRFELQETISSISSRFALTSDINDNINNSFVDMGKLTGASRVYLFLFREDESFMDNTHEWCAEGVSPQIDNLKNLPCDTCPWWMAKLHKGELIHIEDVSKLPKEAVSERKILKEQDIKSLLVLPVTIGGQLGGFIGFDNIKGTGLWSEEDLAILRISSDIIGSALEHKRAEDQLRESEERLKILFECAPDAIYLIDMKGNFVDGNRAAEKLVGYKKEELIGKDFTKTDLLSEEQIPKAVANLVENTAGKSTGPDEFTLKRKDGGYITVEISDFPVNIRNQTLMLCIARDVTERKKASEKLRKSEQKYRDLWENVSDLIQSVAPDGSLIYVNRAWRETLGYSEEEIPQLSLLDIIHPDSHARCMEIFKRLMSGEEIKSFEAMFLTRDGRTIVVEGSANCRCVDGKPVATRAIFRDITERKRAEEELRRSENKYHTLVENLHDIICSYYPDGTIYYISPNVFSWIGYKPEEIVGHNFTEFVHPEDRKRVLRDYEKTIDTGKEFPTAFRVFKRDGGYIYVEECGKILREKGEIVGVTGILRDITDRRRAEEKLLEYQEQLRSMASELSLTEERERRRMATELHDRVMQSLVFSKMRLDKFQESSMSADSGKSLKEISDMLEEAIQETQNLTYDLGSPTLYELGLEAAVEEWLTEEIGQKHNIATLFKNDTAPKPLDEDISAFLFRAVRELLVNVIKHARAQNIEISIRRKSGKIIICVDDDGIGFEFANTSVSRGKKRGYGLFSIKEHLNHIGGCLDIKSRPGHGTQAVLTAPLKENDIKAES